MRYTFANYLDGLMEVDDRIFFITGDLGFKIFDNLFDKYPTRASTVGASEQLMLGMAVGMAQSGKIPFVYSITPFLLYRPFEIIRNYLNEEMANVKLIGSGRDYDYAHDGFSHYAGDDKKILETLPNIKCFWPEDTHILKENILLATNTLGPCYINLSR